MKKIIQFLCLALLLGTIKVAASQNDADLQEQLGAKLPLNLSFVNENGNKILLKNLINKPTIIDFVYYECPGICSPLMTEVAHVANNSDLIPGKDYQIISISFDETESYQVAAQKKKTFLGLIDKITFPDSAWRFLTGDSLSIDKITRTAGFMFKRTGRNFIHTGTLIFVSPEGKICRYLYPDYSNTRGFGILPLDFKMAILEAAQGKQTPVIGKVLQFCFSYDPQGKTYVFNILRVFGAGILLGVIAFVVFIKIKPKKEKSN
ncbi:MAG TPA: SCO family protein [Ignavibacteriaceae bacterium]|nr:SCO family protein [Ignavibacteriaceae bacterium]